MNIKALLIGMALSVGLVACGEASQTGADGYAFKEPEWEASSFTLVPVEYDSQAELRAFAESADVPVGEGRELMAFSIIHVGLDECHVHYVKPQAEYQPEWLGHELAHCLYGRWHSQ